MKPIEIVRQDHAKALADFVAAERSAFNARTVSQLDAAMHSGRANIKFGFMQGLETAAILLGDDDAAFEMMDARRNASCVCSDAARVQEAADAARKAAVEDRLLESRE